MSLEQVILKDVTQNQLENMSLHQEIRTSHIGIVRVIGGWIYEFCNTDYSEWRPVFIPFERCQFK